MSMYVYVCMYLRLLEVARGRAVKRKRRSWMIPLAADGVWDLLGTCGKRGSKESKQRIDEKDLEANYSKEEVESVQRVLVLWWKGGTKEGNCIKYGGMRSRNYPSLVIVFGAGQAR